MKIYGTNIKVIIGEINEQLGYDGFYDPVSKTIAISDKLKGDDLTACLAHELIHSIADRLGWRQWLTREMEEMLCEQISVALAENFTMKLKPSSCGGKKRGKAKGRSK